MTSLSLGVTDVHYIRLDVSVNLLKELFLLRVKTAEKREVAIMQMQT